MRKLWIFGLGITLLIGLYAAYPYYTLHRLGDALDQGDRVALETLVDWPSVRGGLKADLKAMFVAAMAESGRAERPGAALGEGLAAVLGPTLIDRAVDSYLTPATVARLIANAGRVDLDTQDDPSGEPAGPGHEDGRAPITGKLDVTYAFFTGPDSFRVDVVDLERRQKGPLVAIFRLQGLSWRLTRLILPRLDLSSIR